MIALRASEAARMIGARLVGADASFVGCATDSRTIERDAMFVALRGERFDGHDFVDGAVERGAAVVMVERPAPSPVALLEVADTLAGLGALAAGWRARFSLPLAGVTGSAGKTTVKEMLAAILARAGRVLATRGNLNNEIGVPLTLLALDAGHRRAVVEMGANHRGEIARLAAMAAPAVGVITCCGPAHLEGFGTVEEVARAKGELIEALPADGVAVLNADDPHYALWRELAGTRRVLGFGRGDDADVRWRHRPSGEGASVELALAGVEAEIALPLPGAHNAANAAAAVAAAHALGVDDAADWRDGLAAVRPVGGRLNRVAGRRGLRVLDDAYNANPLSLAAAIEVLAAASPPRWVVLGDMGELGAGAADLHRRAGAAARAAGVDHLYATGELSREAVSGFGAGARHFERIEELLRALDDELPAGAAVLVKGSRAARMERVVAALTGAEGEG